MKSFHHLPDYKPKHYTPLVDKNSWPIGLFITGGKGWASKKSEWKPVDCYMADISDRESDQWVGHGFNDKTICKWNECKTWSNVSNMSGLFLTLY